MTTTPFEPGPTDPSTQGTTAADPGPGAPAQADGTGIGGEEVPERDPFTNEPVGEDPTGDDVGRG